MVEADGMFEHDDVDRVLLYRLASVLAVFGKPVSLLPDNHDLLDPGAVSKHPCWE